MVWLNQQKCIEVLEARRPKSRFQQGWFLLGTRRDSVPCLSPAAGGLLAVFGVPWLLLHHPHLCLYPPLASCLCACVQTPLLRMVPAIGVGAHPTLG